VHWQQAEQELAKEYHAREARTDKTPSRVDAPSAATPAVDEAASKKRASRSKPKEDPGAETQGKPTKKQAGDRAIREAPRK
jgi:hypothetical protein